MESYLLLALALLPLIAGPYLAGLAERSNRARSVVDSLVAVALGGVVMLHIWPNAYRHGGPAVLAAGLLGFALPFLLHGRFHAYEKRAFPGLIWLAFSGLALHAMIDGVALFSPEAGHDHGTNSVLLAFAVVLHRLPVALGIWWLVLPRQGARSAVALLVLVGVATVLGFALGDRILAYLSSPALALFEAGVAGMLMHIVFGHERGHASPTPSFRWTSAIGAALGVVVLLAIGHGTPHGEHQALRSMIYIVALASGIWAIRLWRSR